MQADPAQDRSEYELVLRTGLQSDESATRWLLAFLMVVGLSRVQKVRPYDAVLSEHHLHLNAAEQARRGIGNHPTRIAGVLREICHLLRLALVEGSYRRRARCPIACTIGPVCRLLPLHPNPKPMLLAASKLLWARCLVLLDAAELQLAGFVLDGFLRTLACAAAVLPSVCLRQCGELGLSELPGPGRLPCPQLALEVGA